MTNAVGRGWNVDMMIAIGNRMLTRPMENAVYFTYMLRWGGSVMLDTKELLLLDIKKSLRGSYDYPKGFRHEGFSDEDTRKSIKYCLKLLCIVPFILVGAIALFSVVSIVISGLISLILRQL